MGSAGLLAEDWPGWRGPRKDGSWQAPPLPAQWDAGGPPTVWKQPIGAGYSGIAVVGDRVFTMDRPKPTDKNQTPDGHERVVSLSTTDGREIWSQTYDASYGDLDYGTGPRSCPTIHDGMVYTLGAVGTACCLRSTTGEVVWQRDLRAEGAQIPTWGLAASPVIEGNLVILHAGLPKGSVVALDRHTGKEVWRSLDDPAGYSTPIVVRRPGGDVLVVWTPENVHGLDPATGKVYWSMPYKVTYGVAIATPIAEGDILFVSGYWEGSKAYRLGPKPTDCEILYEENRWLRGLMCPPLWKKSTAYLLDKQHGLTRFELSTGKKDWDDQNQLTPRDRNPQASIVWTGQGSRVLALDSDGNLILARFEAEGYVEESRANIIGPTWAHPAFAGDSVYARSDSQIVRVRVAD
jgi:outer membrane protein assembly factor BamB